MKFYWLHIVLFTLLLTACNNKSAPRALGNLGTAQIKVQAPGGREINHPISFYVKTLDKAKKPIALILENGLICKVFHTTTNNKLTIPAEILIHSGKYTITAIANEQILDSRTFSLSPTSLSDPLELYTGPTSIIVGTTEKSMVTVIPADLFDNPITKEKEFYYKSTGAKLLDEKEYISNLYSSTIFTSERKTGKVLISVSHDEKAGREQLVTQSASWPNAFNIEILDLHPYADNRQYTRIRTSKIFDPYGNQIPDGTIVNFTSYRNSRTTGTSKAIIIDGVATVYIKNPNVPATVTIQADIAYQSFSNKLEIAYQRNISKAIYHYDSFTKIFKVGPLRSVLGQLVPDGTKVELILDGKILAKESKDGIAKFKLVEEGILEGGKATMSVNGLTVKIII